MIAQTVTLVADVCSYTRQFLDSALYFFNPLWWVCKAIDAIGFKTQTPSVGIVAKTLLASTIRLLPAALLVTAGVLTAGISIPILQVIAAPLSAFGSLVASTFTAASVATIALGSSIAIYAGGAAAIACKFFSFCAKTVLPNPSSPKVITKTRITAAQRNTPQEGKGNSNNRIKTQFDAARESKENADEVRRTLDGGSDSEDNYNNTEKKSLIQKPKDTETHASQPKNELEHEQLTRGRSSTF